MKNKKLKLNSFINLNEARDEAKKISIKKNFPDANMEQSVIYTLIHKYSNYEEIMWSFWRNEKAIVMSQLKKILIDISKLDRALSWDCEKVFRRYERLYDLKNSKSKWVIEEKDKFPIGKAG